jgi:hypothetical protein
MFLNTKVDGKMKWYRANFVVCLVCDPTAARTSYTNVDKENEAEEDEKTINNYSEEEEEKNNNEGEAKYNEEKDMDHEEDNNNLNAPLNSLTPCATSTNKKQIHCLYFEYFLSVSQLQFQVKTGLCHCLLLLQGLDAIWGPYKTGR